MTEDFDNSGAMIQALFRDLELGEAVEIGMLRDLRQEFGELQNLPIEVLKLIGFDAAIALGLSGDWNLSLEICHQLLSRANDDRMDLKFWKLRSLVELGQYPEALALGTSTHWIPRLLIHVNYLTGEAFEALKMKDEARLRFDAVYKMDANYKNVAHKVIKK